MRSSHGSLWQTAKLRARQAVAPTIRQGTIALLCCSLCFLTTSCGSENRAADAGVNFSQPKSASTGNPADDMPAPPKDAQYTICCRDFSEPSHVQDSRDAQHLLMQSTDMKKWYIVHAADHSTLYYGFYRTIDTRDPNDAAEGKRAIDDLNTIRQMQDSQGNRLFSASLPVPIDSPDPQANPAWDITRTGGYWSIEIAAFTGSADRKQRAVDAVRDARAQGIEAYYYHGDNASSVCIGSWPQEAAVEITLDQQNVNPDQPLVVTNTPLTPQYAEQLQKNNIQTAATHVDVQDPTLTQALGKWKEHSVNGYTMMQKVLDPVTHLEVTQPERPFLFKIPHKDPLDTMTQSDTPAIAPPAPSTDQPAPGTGQLRSLGD
jgi:hypothetical protein